MLTDVIPRRPHLDDVDVTVRDVGLDFDLVPQALGHPLTSPEADAVEISVRKRHHTSVPLS